MSILVILTVSAEAHTGSFFSDIEGAPVNNLNASALDDVLLGEPVEGLVCADTPPRTSSFEVHNEGSDTHNITFAVTSAPGGFCDVLLGELSMNGDILYDGPIAGLTSDMLELSTGSTTTFSLAVRLAPESLTFGTCNFETTLTSQQSHLASGGFSDIEMISHTVSGDVSSCGGGPTTATSTVDLYLNKHISGETLGYALSDFSYRVTGNGIDVLVPHDHTTPLPVGTYTIEEIVPDGFEKVDWRIGWYGQCERGSAFTTTITIDDGNIDHGTLYCEADNQYRPGDDNGNEEEEEVEADTEEDAEEGGEVDEVEETTDTETGGDKDEDGEEAEENVDQEESETDEEDSGGRRDGREGRG